MYIQHHMFEKILESCDDLDIRICFGIFRPIRHSCTFVPQPCICKDMYFSTWLLNGTGLQYVKYKYAAASWVCVPLKTYYFYDPYAYYV